MTERQYYRVKKAGLEIGASYDIGDVVALTPEQAKYHLAPYPVRLELIEPAAAADLTAAIAAYRAQWLGSLSADPTLDADGNAVAPGARYYNRITDAVRILRASGWNDDAASAADAAASAATAAAARDLAQRLYDDLMLAAAQSVAAAQATGADTATAAAARDAATAARDTATAEAAAAAGSAAAAGAAAALVTDPASPPLAGGITAQVGADGRIAVGFNLTAGPAIITGDRAPTCGPMQVPLLTGQSNGAATQAASMPALSIGARNPLRQLMTDALGAGGSGGLDLTTKNLKIVVPAREGTIAGVGETFVSGFAHQWCGYHDARNMPTQAMTWLNMAQGGAMIAQISKGTTPWNNMLDALRALKKLYGSIRVPFDVFSQGTSDDTKTKAQYKALLLQYYTDLNTDVPAITGQDEPIPIWVEHFGFVASPYAGAGGVQDALLELHQEAMADPNAPRIMIGATGAGAVHGDAYHYCAAERRRLGAQWAQSICRWEYEQRSTVFWPTSATASGHIITVHTNAATPLAIDTSVMADRTSVVSGPLTGAVGKYGIVVTNAAGAWQPITGITTSGTDILIDMGAGNPAASWIVNCGQTDMKNGTYGPGGRTLIYDTDPDVMILNRRTSLRASMLCSTLAVT